MNSIAQLRDLYSKNSKHSNYQILSDKLTSIIGIDKISVKSRCERERLDYILGNMPVGGKSVLDIGGNSGFFTFEAIENGAKNVHYYEGNTAHSDFVKVASKVLGCADKVDITNDYYAFESSDTRKYDIVFLLNVLHHLGDDYGINTLLIDAAKEEMMAQLNSMAVKTSHLVLQLGFCWKGNRDNGLFEKGTKSELIDFVVNSARSAWQVKSIGIPVLEKENVVYVDLDEQNINRDDSLGEFLNRPLFILESKR